jgi:hypothetical protein
MCILRPAIAVSPRLSLWCIKCIRITSAHISGMGIEYDIQVIRHIAKRKRDRDLQEKTHGCKGITCKSLESKSSDNRRRICVEGSLRTVVRQCDQDVDVQAPIGKLLIKIRN